MKKIKVVGVVGAGTMGSALAQKFSQEGFRVILADRELNYVEKGLAAIRSTLEEGVQRKVFTNDDVQRFLSGIKGTGRLDDLQECDLVIEAVFEDLQVKKDLMKSLSGIVKEDCIVATNTSSFSVTELSKSITHHERFIGLHFFYHAAKNRLVEIIPGEYTSEETVEAIKMFAILAGKDAILCKDVYGFAVNRFFVPWLNEAIKLVEEKIATVEMIEQVGMKTFGIGMGPFALMNATGVPISLHAQRTLEFFGPSYKVASLLEQQVSRKENWNIGDTTGLTVDPATEKQIRERLLGCVFFVCSEILSDNVCSAIDLNKGAKIGLRWKHGPVDLMKQSGEAEVKRLVGNYALHYGETKPPVAAYRWKMDYVSMEKRKDRVILTVNRPEDLNALNEETIRMLDELFTQADNDPAIKSVFITGSGKAFVAGADIKFFVKHMTNNSLDKIVEFTSYGQTVFEKIDRSKKNVVALLNGMALGGGLELALCCDVILAVPKASVGFPETGIGIYPGLGGTQRTATRVGKGLAKFLILTGKTLKAKEACDTGLIDEIIPAEDQFEILAGSKPVPASHARELSPQWKAIADLYSKNTYRSIINGTYSNGSVDHDQVTRLGRTMSRKAPLAMQIAEELIEQAKGPRSELEKLTVIFRTSDAMKGLTSIGKSVDYEGK